MDQFTREVDEEYRREQMAALWKRWGTLAVSVLVVVVVGVAGWTFWESRERQAAEAAALQLYEAGLLIEEGSANDARTMLEQAVAEASGPTADLARLRLAALEADTDREAGAAAFDAIADDANAPAVWRDLARLRAALLRVDSAPEEAGAVLQSLAADGGAFRHTAREQLGLMALDRGDYDAAAEWFDRIAVDSETPGGLRQRLEIYSALVAAGPVAASQ